MRFNVRTQKKPVTRNHAGAKAYRMTPEMELYTAVVTASLSGKFYETDQARYERIVKLIQTVDPQFVAKLAIYTREKMYLRSIPVVLAIELANRLVNYGQVFRLFIVNVPLLILIFGTLTKKLFRVNVIAQLGRKLGKQITLSG